MMSHSIQVNYKAWGLGSQPKIVSAHIDEKIVKENIDAIEKIFPPLKLHCSSTISVNYFQGSNSPDKKLLLFRFNASTPKERALGGEHVSVLMDPIEHKIFGWMDLRVTTSKKVYTTHEAALDTALSFLKNAAPDLVSLTSSLPDMLEHNTQPGEKITFSDHPKIAINEASRLSQKKFTIIPGMLSHNEFLKALVSQMKLVKDNYQIAKHSSEISPAQIRGDKKMLEKLIVIASKEIKEHGIDCFTLGCGSFIGIATPLQLELQKLFGSKIYVVDPITTTFEFVKNNITSSCEKT